MPVSGPEIARGAVVLRNGLIDSVGTQASEPAGAWVIEGSGLTVYPGLIDALRSCGSQPGGTQQRASGPEDRPETYTFEKAADLISPADVSLVEARNAGFTTAVCFPDRGIFSPQGVVYNLAGEKPGQMLIQAPAGIAVAMRSSGPSGGFPNSLMGVIAYVRQLFLDAAHYRTASEIYSANPVGYKRPEHDRTLEGLLAAPRTLLPASDGKEIARMLGLAEELKLNAVLYGLHGGWNSAALLKKNNTAALLGLRWPEAARDPDPEAERSYRTLELRDRAPSTAAALANAQVKFAFYSRGLERPADAAPAVRRAIEAGLSQSDAIRAMTLSAAEIYGVADRMGSLEKGKIANLVVTQGDLFATRTTVKYVFIDGMKFDVAEAKR